MLDISKLLSPSSIAVIGASNNPQKIGGIVLKNIIESGYTGKVFPINPKESLIQGLDCFPNITSLKETPDLVIFAIPSSILLPILIETGEKQGKNILIYSAGFKEAGAEGVALETELLAIAKKYSLNILGPNCLGFVNNSLSLNATFSKASNQNGNLRILSQSGAIATSFLDWSQKIGLGINQLVTLGNKSVLNENHFLEAWRENPIVDYDETGLSNNQPVGIYLESITSGPKFLELCKQITSTNPIFIIKPGKTIEAGNAMMSHTGSLAGNDEVLSAALEDAGTIRCDTLEDFFNMAKTASWENPPQGPNLAIISNAGGPAVISTDYVGQYSLKLAKLSEETTHKLHEILPRMAGVHDPVDILGDALSDRYNVALDIVLQEKTVDSVLIILTPQIMTEIEATAKIIGELNKKYKKPIVCSFIGGSQIEIGQKVLNQFHIPSFEYPEQAIKAISKLYKWSEFKKEFSQQTFTEFKPNYSISHIDNLLKSASVAPGLLDTQTTSYFLELAQINKPSSIVTENLSIAKEFSLEVDWPVVLKTTQKNLLHKSDGGGVITNVSSLEELTKAWQSINSDGQPIETQKQISCGQELIVGFKRDNVFGNTLFFGAGGKYVSIFEDKNLCLFPLNELKLTKLIKNSKVYPLLNGFRGDHPLDIQKIVSLCQKLGFVFEHLTQISEMEINPVILNQEGIYAVDTKIILA